MCVIFKERCEKLRIFLNAFLTSKNYMIIDRKKIDDKKELILTQMLKRYVTLLVVNDLKCSRMRVL